MMMKKMITTLQNRKETMIKMRCGLKCPECGSCNTEYSEGHRQTSDTPAELSGWECICGVCFEEDSVNYDDW